MSLFTPSPQEASLLVTGNPAFNLPSPGSSRGPQFAPPAASTPLRRWLLPVGGAVLLVVVVLAATLGTLLRPPSAPPPPAPTVFTSTANLLNGTLRGTATFTAPAAGFPVTLTLAVAGVATNPGALHGLHVHANVMPASAAMDTLCMAAGGHFNPDGANHGDIADSMGARHVGDMGNVQVAADGTISLSLTDQADGMALSGPHNISFRTLILHALPDDLGRGGNPASLAKGNSGARMACAVIVPSVSAVGA